MRTHDLSCLLEYNLQTRFLVKSLEMEALQQMLGVYVSLGPHHFLRWLIICTGSSPSLLTPRHASTSNLFARPITPVSSCASRLSSCLRLTALRREPVPVGGRPAMCLRYESSTAREAGEVFYPILMFSQRDGTSTIF